MKSAYAIHPILVFIHICMGLIGLLSGIAALSFHKGSYLHRTAGNIYFISMLTMSALGAYGAYFVPEMISVLVGILTFYLVATAWMTVKRYEGEIGKAEYLTLTVALLVALAGLIYGREASTSESGLKDGFPPGIYYFFGSVALFAAVSDILLIYRKGVSGVQRIVRHLWRMCFALLIAAASLFLGQPQVFPESIQDTPILFIPVLTTLAVMIYWLIRVLFTSWYSKANVK